MAGENQQQQNDQDQAASSESKEKQQQQQQQKKKSDKKQQKQKSENPLQPATPRHNKLYRTPPTPQREELIEKESAFVLDSVAMSSISQDYSTANPKLGSVIPPYNSQRDRRMAGYFKNKYVQETLKHNMQFPPRDTSMEGKVYDNFYENGTGYRYLTPRAPCGHSNEFRMGHDKDMWKHPNPSKKEFDKVPRELEGYNGRFGFRRNTPALRKEPSTFGMRTHSSIY